LSKNVPIKETPFALRPREKFKKYGSSFLDNSELLAILLGSGVAGKNVSEVSKSILKKYESGLVDTNYKELMRERGIGEVKAIQLHCAFELSKRLLKTDDTKPLIQSVADLEPLLRPFKTEKKEHLIAFYLSATNHLLAQETISIGTVEANLIHPREVFAPAFEYRATAVIIAHNHPFGDSKPSKEDIEITKKIVEAGEVLGIKLIDHIIVSQAENYSFFGESQLRLGVAEPMLYLRQGAVQRSLFELDCVEISVTKVAKATKATPFVATPNKVAIQQRRYLGNKYGVLNLIDEVVKSEIGEFESLCDIFAGTGVVGHRYNTQNRRILSNDLLFCNYITTTAFLGSSNIDETKILEIIDELNNIKPTKPNYVSINFGGKYFTNETALRIGGIREKINQLFIANSVNFQEKSILLTSLLYAMDRVANTVGHYDAYIKKEPIRDNFILKIPKIDHRANANNQIYNLDANTLIRQIECDVLYIDPPYNSRQYSDSYHLLENIMRWEKPELHGEARKFDRTHIKSEYSLKSATRAFADLIENAKCEYILFSYNNMADKGNNRSNARIKDEDIMEILGRMGKVKIFEQEYKEFTTGKSDRGDNSERVFFLKINQGRRI